MTHVSSAIFIAVCVEALLQGGPGLLATLVVVSTIAQGALSARLSLLHRVLTPIVTGTVIMLLPVTVMPILFDMLNELPPGAPAHAGPLSAVVTISAILGIAFKAEGTLRLWAPAAGIVAGSLASAFFGSYDTARAGIVHLAAVRSISSQRAARASPAREKPHASEVLRRRRPLSLAMIRVLAADRAFPLTCWCASTSLRRLEN